MLLLFFFIIDRLNDGIFSYVGNRYCIVPIGNSLYQESYEKEENFRVVNKLLQLKILQ